MSKTVQLNLVDRDLRTTLSGLWRAMLEQPEVTAILVPLQQPGANQVMPMLVSDPAHLDRADPLAPAFPLNAAKMVSKLTRKTAGQKVVAVLRPCEIRAFIELVKLHQGARDELVIVGLDCLGAFNNRDFRRFGGDDLNAAVAKFTRNALAGEPGRDLTFDITPACRACDHPLPEGADIAIRLLGRSEDAPLVFETQTAAGQTLVEQLALDPAADDQTQATARRQAVETLLTARRAARKEMVSTTAAATDTIEKLNAYFAACVNCYNCRVACPVCYCKECVFLTDAFNHDPIQYLQWSKRKGEVKMPTDTVFFHLTRLAHMSTACVGCGQCSNACPNDIPVMELFQTVALGTQNAFAYEAGRSVEEKPPLSEFKAEEFEEVVGIG